MRKKNKVKIIFLGGDVININSSISVDWDMKKAENLLKKGKPIILEMPDKYVLINTPMIKLIEIYLTEPQTKTRGRS